MGNVGVYAKLHATGNEPPYWPFNVVERAIRDAQTDPEGTGIATIRNATWQHFSDWTQGIFAPGRAED
eukprot:6094879-Prorocentrum_lima.AAC.1